MTLRIRPHRPTARASFALLSLFVIAGAASGQSESAPAATLTDAAGPAAAATVQITRKLCRHEEDWFAGSNHADIEFVRGVCPQLSLFSLAGDIRGLDRATTLSATTVTGDIRLGRDVQIGNADSVDSEDGADGSLSTTTGVISAQPGSRIFGDVLTIAGRIEFAGTEVVGNVESCEGDVTLDAGSRVSGQIRVIGTGDRPDPALWRTAKTAQAENADGKKDEDEDEEQDPPACYDGGMFVPDIPKVVAHRRSRIVIGPDSVVTGGVIAGHDVDLYVHRSAHVGPVHGTRAIAYDDDPPPAAVPFARPAEMRIVTRPAPEGEADTVPDDAEPDDVVSLGGDIRLAAGAAANSLTTIGVGTIRLEHDAQVYGNVSAESGGIVVDDGASADGIVAAVDGQIRLGRNVQVEAASAGDGGLITSAGTHIGEGGVFGSNSGPIRLVGTRVDGDVCVHGGEVTLGAGTQVAGDLSVSADCIGPGGLADLSMRDFVNVEPRSERIPRIVVAAGAQVAGDLEFDRKVVLYVHRDARIGAVSGTRAITFDGDAPPP